jgi:hypothetical protein
MKKRDKKAKMKEIGDETLKLAMLVMAALEDGKPITKKMMKAVEKLEDKLKKINK